MQLQKCKDVGEMEKYGNGRKRKKGGGGRRGREEGIMITITYWEWLSIRNFASVSNFFQFRYTVYR